MRVDTQGDLAQTPHPEFLGSKLCHPMITTDFSEAQLELITPVNESIEDSLSTLEAVHRFVHSGLEDELLWASSMPCVVPDNDKIPLARYGSSNLGKLKTTYRNGLGYRYGRAMQTICAIHYNFSFPEAFWLRLKEIEQSDESMSDYRSRRYFDLMRNFRRYSWLLVYLFGASPAVCKSFLTDRDHELEEFDFGSAYLPNATSLRNGNLGYQSDSQSDLLNICYNNLDNYIESLRKAICTPHPTFSQLDGNEEKYLQVNANILQSEAEFYTTIRAKRVPAKGENFLSSLSKQGVEYLEVRLLDVNPYLPLGIDATEIRFLDTFLLFCLLTESPAHDEDVCSAVQANVLKTVQAGRKEGLLLDDNGSDKTLSSWGQEILAAMSQASTTLDANSSSSDYSHSLAEQLAKINDSEQTPSARMLKDMRDQSIPFFRLGMNQAIKHQRYFSSMPLSDEERTQFEDMSTRSNADQKIIEAGDSVDFDQYLLDLQQEYQNLNT